MCGLPGAGKSKVAQEILATYPSESLPLLIESDYIRDSMGVYIPGVTGRYVRHAMEALALGALLGGRCVLLDTTCLTVEHRSTFLWWALQANAHTELHYVKITLKESIRRSEKWIDKKRLTELHKTFKSPTKAEGWERIVRHEG